MDYARSHVSVIEMLKNFHYINSEGKDQGINVRNRASELTALLGDVNKIRTERKIARANKAKYGGIGNTGDSWGGSSSGGAGFGGTGKKYGGFGSDSGSAQYGGNAGGVYGDGGGFGGSEYEGPGYSRSSNSRATNDDDFEEYEVAPTRDTASSSRNKAPVSSKPAAPQPDLFSFDDEPAPSAQPTATSSNAFGDDDDDFADFQSATQVSAPTPQSAAAPPNTSKPLPAANDNLFDLFSGSSSSAFQTAPVANNNSSLLSFGGASSTSSFGSAPLTLNNSTTLSGSTSTVNSGNVPKKAAKDDAFGGLWATTKKSAITGSKPSTPKPASTPMGSNQSSTSLI